jgi:hypothetical protein
MTQDKPDTIAQLCQRIWEIEKRHQLLDLTLSGVHIWQACRMHIYYKLAEGCGLYEHPHVAAEGRWPFLLKLEFFIRSLTFDNPFLNPKAVDFAVFDHARSKALEGKNVDIYSYFLCKELAVSGDSFIVFERPFLNQYTKDHDFERRRVGAIDAIAGFASNIPFMVLSASERKMVRDLQADIQHSFGVRLDLQGLFSLQIRRFMVRRFLYGKLLDRFAIKKVYLVVSYYLSPLIDSCKRRGIPVHELQHGVINKYHLGYSFPGREPGTLQYFPDALLQWGGNWPTTKHLPLSDSQRIDYGFKYFTASSAHYRDRKRNPQKALIVSQSVHGNSLAAFIRDNIASLEGWDICYKLHPSEFNRHNDYHDLKLLSATAKNFSVVEGGDLHELLAESTAVIGVFSTVLFEALEFDCDVYICPLSGWEYMDELLEKGTVKPFAALKKI